MAGPVKIALVGLGWWGQKMLTVLEAASDDIAVVRAVEPNVDAARDLCATKGIALSADFSDALNDPEVEAVVLATPHSLHTEQVAQAAAAGKHIFCEKPLALTAAEAAQSVSLCANAGLVLGMGHERRWEPAIAEMLAKADAGELGRIQQIEANFSHDKFVSLDRDNWRLKADQAPAGGMTATGIHLLREWTDRNTLPQVDLGKWIISVERLDLRQSLGLQHETAADHCLVVIGQKWPRNDRLDRRRGQIGLVILVMCQPLFDGTVVVQAMMT